MATKHQEKLLHIIDEMNIADPAAVELGEYGATEDIEDPAAKQRHF